MHGFALSWIGLSVSAWWLGVWLGAGIGMIYIVISLVANRYAMRQQQGQFMLIVVGGMLVRMLVALGIVALVLVLLPVEEVTFIGSFFGVFVIGLALEVWMVHRSSSMPVPQDPYVHAAPEDVVSAEGIKEEL